MEKELNDSDEEDEGEKFCSFALTGAHENGWLHQPIYLCRTCCPSDQGGGPLQCVCESCAETCHAGHDVDYLATVPGAYCDCSSVHHGCQILSASNAFCIEEKIDTSSFQHKTDATKQGDTNVLLPPMEPFFHSAYHLRTTSADSMEDCCEEWARQAYLLASHTKNTHWISHDVDTEELRQSRSGLEQLAWSIFQYHKKVTLKGDDEKLLQLAGVEWWVQTKPTGVDLHFDKDEELASLQQFGALASFPLVSTVTYLTSSGHSAAPTIVFPYTYNQDFSKMENALVSCVEPSKHLAFDGTLLHGAPPCLHPTQSSPGLNDTRVTFLANIWVTRPMGICELPKEISQILRIGTSTGTTIPKSLTLSWADAVISRENVLTGADDDRVDLPFLSKGATWIEENEEDDDEDSDVGLVVNMLRPPIPANADENSTVLLQFGLGAEAKLQGQGSVSEDDA
eukprot:scaffold10422_cov55-Attheya_sp.AAC.2